jgi:hypothetical protein
MLSKPPKEGRIGLNGDFNREATLPGGQHGNELAAEVTPHTFEPPFVDGALNDVFGGRRSEINQSLWQRCWGQSSRPQHQSIRDDRARFPGFQRH